MVRCPECHKNVDENSAHTCYGLDGSVGERKLGSIEFKECASCKAKPGTPALCAECLHNRTVIDRLKEDWEALRARQQPKRFFTLETPSVKERPKEKHAFAEELRRLASRQRALGQAPEWELDAKLIERAAELVESHYETRHEWVNGDLLRMEQDLRAQAKELHDWHDPNGRRVARLMRARASLLRAFALLAEQPTSCGQPSPSGPCRRAQGHQPPWGHQGESPDPWPTEDPLVECRNDLCGENDPRFRSIPHTHERDPESKSEIEREYGKFIIDPVPAVCTNADCRLQHSYGSNGRMHVTPKTSG